MHKAKFSPVIKIKDENTHQTTASKIKDTTKRSQNPFRSNKSVLISCESVCDKIFTCGFCAHRNCQLLSYLVTFSLFLSFWEIYRVGSVRHTSCLLKPDTSRSRHRRLRAEGWGKALQTLSRAFSLPFYNGKVGQICWNVYLSSVSVWKPCRIKGVRDKRRR